MAAVAEVVGPPPQAAIAGVAAEGPGRVDEPAGVGVIGVGVDGVGGDPGRQVSGHFGGLGRVLGEVGRDRLPGDRIVGRGRPERSALVRLAAVLWQLRTELA
jgi:hypothetical protein